MWLFRLIILMIKQFKGPIFGKGKINYSKSNLKIVIVMKWNLCLNISNSKILQGKSLSIQIHLICVIKMTKSWMFSLVNIFVNKSTCKSSRNQKVCLVTRCSISGRSGKSIFLVRYKKVLQSSVLLWKVSGAKRHSSFSQLTQSCQCCHQKLYSN